jgi:hypothetical protein
MTNDEREVSMTRTVPLAVALVLFAGSARSADEAKGEKVEFVVHGGQFEKNNAGLKGDQSFLLLTTREGFDKIFGAGFVMGKKPNVVPKDAFEKSVVAATIKRGNAITTYEVEKVTLDKDGTLYVQYKAATGAAGTASFASPLIISAPKDKVKKVTFIENGKTVGTAEAK